MDETTYDELLGQAERATDHETANRSGTAGYVALGLKAATTPGENPVAVIEIGPAHASSEALVTLTPTRHSGATTGDAALPHAALGSKRVGKAARRPRTRPTRRRRRQHARLMDRAAEI